MSKLSKEFKIGIAFVLALFLLYFGISFLKGVNIFKPSNSYVVVFDDVTGLTKSTPVTVNGFNIGLVSDIKLDAENPTKILTYINLQKDIKIPKGSKLFLDVSALGNSSLMLEFNQSSTDYLHPTDTIYGVRKAGLMDAAGEFVPQLGNLIPKIDSILTGIQLLVNNPALNESLTNVNLITSELASSSKQLNLLLNNMNKDVPMMTNNLKSITHDLSETTKQLNQIDLAAASQSIGSTLKNIENLSSKLNSKDNSVGLLLNDRQLYDSLNITISNASLLLKDVKENPQRYINVKVF